MRHLTQTIMWVGGYSDWTSAEQREWDRDIKELRGGREQRDMTETSSIEKGKDELSWLELAKDFHLFKVSYTRVNGTALYVADMKQLLPRKQGTRNLDFELVYPLYVGLNEIIEKRKTPNTTIIKGQVCSREHADVTYECNFSPDKWSYITMDKITEELSDQLTMKQNLNRGLVMKLLLYEY